MILVGWKLAFSDCYVQRASIQMGLLKQIEGNKVFNIWGVCPKWNSWWVDMRMNISGIDLTIFCIALFGQTCHEKEIQGIALADRHCGNHEDIKNIWMKFPQWFRS